MKKLIRVKKCVFLFALSVISSQFSCTTHTLSGTENKPKAIVNEGDSIGNTLFVHRYNIVSEVNVSGSRLIDFINFIECGRPNMDSLVFLSQGSSGFMESVLYFSQGCILNLRIKGMDTLNIYTDKLDTMAILNSPIWFYEISRNRVRFNQTDTLFILSENN